jgi:hypothetical protein
MDTIGLLAAWVSVVSFLVATILAIAYHLARNLLERFTKPDAGASPEGAHSPGSGDVAALVSLYGSTIVNLIGAVGLLIVSIEILDLGPAMLAATLPFHIDSKLLTRGTGVLTLIIAYFFLFRLAYLGIRIANATRLYRYRDSLLSK